MHAGLRSIYLVGEAEREAGERNNVVKAGAGGQKGCTIPAVYEVYKVQCARPPLGESRQHHKM